MDNSAGPASDRIEIVDALRGLALLGILLANILVLSGWEFLTDAQRMALAGAEAVEWQRRAHHFFIDGKFYTIFSLLFGAGFALQIERLSRRGANGLRIFRRRMLILLGFGLVHSWLIWDGDILTLYALMGLLLPFVRHWRDRQLLVAAFVLIFVVPVVGIALFKALGWAPHKTLFALSDRIALSLGAINPSDGVTWLRRTDFWGWFSFVMSGPTYSWALKLQSWRIPKVLGIMILGTWLGRRLSNGQILNDRKLLWQVAVVGLLIGVPANLYYALEPGLWQADWPSLIGTVPLGLAYAAGFALAWPRAKRWLSVFAWPGRMALTNYLTQSTVSIVVFYGFGFGQIGYWPPLGFYLYAVALYAAQVAFSYWWLKSHSQGPMEALWRRWTYAGNQPLTAGAKGR